MTCAASQARRSQGQDYLCQSLYEADLIAVLTSVWQFTSFRHDSFRISSSSQPMVGAYTVCFLARTCLNATIASLHASLE